MTAATLACNIRYNEQTNKTEAAMIDDVNPTNWTSFQQFIGGGISLILGFLGVKQWMVRNAANKADIASEDATAAQFATLRSAIEANRQETADLRSEVVRMDRIVHLQQRTITRMEMLLRQFSGLVQENGITVPEFMQSELEELIVRSDE